MKIKMVGSILFLGITQIVGGHAMYYKKLDRIVAPATNRYQFFRIDTSLFSRLTFSGRAKCFSRGHLTFSAQARNAHTHRWSRWHRMFEWGKKRRSYITKSDGFCRYGQIQLETEPLQLADGFRIKVVGARKAPVTNLKYFSVRISDVRKKNENAYKKEKRS